MICRVAYNDDDANDDDDDDDDDDHSFLIISTGIKGEKYERRRLPSWQGPIS